MNDEIQKVVSKYEELKKPIVPHEPEPAMIPVAVEPEESPRHKDDALIRKPGGSRVGGSNEEMMDDLDEMIFGKKVGGGASDGGHDPKKQGSSKDDLISF